MYDFIIIIFSLFFSCNSFLFFMMTIDRADTKVTPYANLEPMDWSPFYFPKLAIFSNVLVFDEHGIPSSRHGTNKG